jgi:hypothetical protein
MKRVQLGSNIASIAGPSALSADSANNISVGLPNLEHLMVYFARRATRLDRFALRRRSTGDSEEKFDRPGLSYLDWVLGFAGASMSATWL